MSGCRRRDRSAALRRPRCQRGAPGSAAAVDAAALDRTAHRAGVHWAGGAASPAAEGLEGAVCRRPARGRGARIRRRVCRATTRGRLRSRDRRRWVDFRAHSARAVAKDGGHAADRARRGDGGVRPALVAGRWARHAAEAGATACGKRIGAPRGRRAFDVRTRADARPQPTSSRRRSAGSCARPERERLLESSATRDPRGTLDSRRRAREREIFDRAATSGRRARGPATRLRLARSRSCARDPRLRVPAVLARRAVLGTPTRLLGATLARRKRASSRPRALRNIKCAWLATDAHGR